MDSQFALYQRTRISGKGERADDTEAGGEIRKLFNEQQNKMRKNAQINSSQVLPLFDDDSTLPIPPPPNQRFTPLPDIPRADDVYFRTESKLVKEAAVVAAAATKCEEKAVHPIEM